MDKYTILPLLSFFISLLSLVYCILAPIYRRHESESVLAIMKVIAGIFVVACLTFITIAIVL